ncbi:DUF935 domain-containing protein [Acinetobacter baumannii]|uniref:DUF935 domain-containing protein n=1 Tax=Acinetobacter baumannii TaxID=470 RepID=UPI0034D97A76
MAKKDRTSKKQNLSSLETRQTAEIAWLQTQWQEHPVVGMTPQRLHQLLTDAEQGNLQAQADLFCDMEERDGHIFSEMDKRKKGVNGLDWNVKPPRKNPTPQEKKIAEEVAEWIGDIKNLELVFYNALDAIGHGYSCQELEWERLGNLWLPKEFHYTIPRNFMTPHNQPNCLRINDGTIEGAEFWDFGWFIHKHQAKSGYIARSGLHRVLSWPFLFKNYGVRDVMEFLETYGLPSKIGKYQEGATQEEKLTLLRAVMSIGRNAGGIIPKGMSIEFEKATDGDTKNHFDLVDWCEKTESKVIVGGTLLSQADGKTSTNAQSNTHEIQFKAINKSDAKQLARSLSDNLIAPMMRINYPEVPRDRYPEFWFDTSDTEDMESFSNSLDKLVRVGLRIPRSWAHGKLGIPEPADDQEPVLGIVQQPSQIPNLALNTFQPNLLNSLIAANSAQLPVEEQALQLLVKDQSENAQATAEDWTKQLLAKIDAGNEEEILALLQDVYPADDEPALQEKLTRLIFAAEVMGHLSVQAEQS